jgi:hypothetical protein
MQSRHQVKRKDPSRDPNKIKNKNKEKSREAHGVSHAADRRKISRPQALRLTFSVHDYQRDASDKDHKERFKGRTGHKHQP